VTTSLAAAPRTRWPGTLVESVTESDLKDLFATVARLAGVAGLPAPVRLARVWAPPPPTVLRDSLSRYADLLGRLTDVYSVSAHEAPMRDAVRELLPAWARDSAVVDSAGNLVLGIGPDRDTVVFVAHMDEVGFAVTRIGHDGTVSLRSVGGFFPSLFEGQTALLHLEDEHIPSRDARSCGAAREGPLRGVFVPRDSATRKQPAQLTAWFGLDSLALARAGVVIGSSVTSYKCSARLAGTRFTARSIDDRAGSSALILALESIERSNLDHRVIFAWSVREESGLEGAKALAQTVSINASRVYAIDTFVSSDSPLESSRFANAKLGEGAVARALDNSSVTPPDEVDRLTRIARAGRIPLQVGTTNGGNDGSELARYGALDDAVGWPLRYSHSPAEVIDLRDIRSLARMIAALASSTR
jgi:putative aminopeptidase FrvX